MRAEGTELSLQSQAIELLQRTELFDEEPTRAIEETNKGTYSVTMLDYVKNDETG